MTLVLNNCKTSFHCKSVSRQFQKFKTTIQAYLQTTTDLTKETAVATSELQIQFQKIHKIVTDFAIKYTRENPEAKAFAAALNNEETPTIYEQQNKLIADSKEIKVEMED